VVAQNKPRRLHDAHQLRPERHPVTVG
jgi:hypothetical protein